MEIRVTQLSELLSHLKTNEEPVKQDGPARRDASPRGRLRLTRSGTPPEDTPEHDALALEASGAGFLKVVRGTFASWRRLNGWTDERREGGERAAACEKAITPAHLLTRALAVAHTNDLALLVIVLAFGHRCRLAANGRNELIMLPGLRDWNQQQLSNGTGSCCWA